MPLRFRSVVPYTLPGVLALIGWWWYVSRKKEQITSRDGEGGAVAMGLLTSSSEGSNGLVEKASVSPSTSAHQITGRDPPPKVKVQRSTEQKVEVQVHVPATRAAPAEVQNILPPTVSPTPGSPRSPFDPHQDRENADPAATASCQVLTRTSATQPPASTPMLRRQEEGLTAGESERDQWAAGLSPPLAGALVTEPTLPEVSQVAAVVSQVLYATPLATPVAAELANAERPEPEGEVSGKEAPSSSSSSSSTSTTTTSTKDTLVCPPSSPALDQRTATEEPHTPETVISSQGIQHQATACPPVPLSPAPDSLLPQGLLQENGTRGEDLEDLAAGLITEVISAATTQVLSVTCCPDANQSDSETTKPGCSSSTPLANGKPCSEQEPIRRDSWPSPIGHELKREESANQEEEAVPNGCPSAPVWEPMSGHRERVTDNTQISLWPTTLQEAQDSTVDKLKEEGHCLGPAEVVAEFS